MGASAETVSSERDAPSRSSGQTGSQPASVFGSASRDATVDRLFGAESLSVPHLKAPVMQRAQRTYGNRASQQWVMRAGVLQRHCTCGGTCSKCREDEKHVLQRFTGIPSSAGAALDAPIRRPLERHFEADLTDVRVHTGSQAADSARDLDALAYTSGRDIYFAEGMYAPSSGSGQRLLAHEVAHVVQQSAGKEPNIGMKSAAGTKIGAPDDALEADAEQQADQFMSGKFGEQEQLRWRSSPAVLEDVIQRQQASTPKAVNFHGYTLERRPEYLRSVLAQVGSKRGHEAMDLFVLDLESGQYSDPEQSGAPLGAGEGAASGYSPEQLQLLAEIGPVMRGELDRLKADYQAFGNLVRNAAVVRLTRNHYNLGLWRDYVQSLAPQQVMGMAIAQEERSVLMGALHSHAKGPFNPLDIYEQRAWSKSRFEREYLERLATGRIHGGCEQCHEQRLARDLESHSPTIGEAAIPVAVRMPRYAGLNVQTPAPGGELAGQNETQPAVPDWGVSAIGNRPGSQRIAASLNQIRDYLRPLGDGGYRIISDQMISDATDSAALVASVLSAISERRTGYLNLIDEIQNPGYNFLEPLQIVQQLLPFADPDVRAVVEGEIRVRQAKKEADAKTGFVLGIAAMLLTIFPPTAPIGLALGAGLAVWGFASGFEDWQQGRRFEMGKGGGVFSREQEDAGRAMQAMGIFTMALSAFALADAGVGAARLLRAPARGLAAMGAAEQVVGAEATSSGIRIRIEGLDGASPIVTIAHADGTIERFTVEELESTLSRMGPGGAARRGSRGGTPFENPLEHIPQKQPNWCGAACGEMAASRLGTKVSQEELAASEFFEKAFTVEGQTVKAGGFETMELKQALSELAPVKDRKWIALDLTDHFPVSTPADVPKYLPTVLRDTEASVILRVRGGNHWIVVDQVTSEGMIAIRDPAARVSQLLKPEELAAMHPIGEAVISVPVK